MTKDEKEPLYLVDGSGFIFRAYHALPFMSRPDGTPVHAVYGYCAMLQKLLLDLGAQHIAVIFDAARKTFRQDIYPAYKANRPPPPEDLVPQFALIRQATEAFGLPALEAANYEADDLIAAYARAAREKKIPVRIVSADKDLMQLVGAGVTLYDPMKSIDIDEKAVEEKFGVPPAQVVDVQALAGDSSDNVPGVPGIGIKTAAELIASFGNLETLLKKADTIKQPKRRQALLDHADLALISQKLVTLDAHAPMPMPLEEILKIPAQGQDKTPLMAFLQAQAFKSLLARLEKQTGQKAPPLEEESKEAEDLAAIKTQYSLIQDIKALKPWLEKAKDQGFVALDTETNGLVPSTAKLVGVSLATAPGQACYIPLGHVAPGSAAQEGAFDFDATRAPKQIDLAAFTAAIKPLLEDESVLKIAHNLKFDSQVLGQHGIKVNTYDDTMLMSYVLDAGLHGHGLDDLVKRNFDHEMIAFDAVTGTGRARITFDRVPLEQASDYAAEDADFTLRLWQEFKQRLVQEKLVHVYERLERPLIPVVAAMETIGVKIDPVILRAQSSKLAQHIAVLEKEIYKLAGHPFNVGSPKQLAEVLFEEMGLPAARKSSKTGAHSTGADVLEPLADQYDIVAKILEWRAWSKLKSTYTDALPAQINPKTGRVHTSFSLVGAATGRLSSTDPNLQNIPIRTEEGRAIRKAFIAPEGYKLMSVDYSQIELRLAAEASQSPSMMKAFEKGIDIHAMTASEVFDIPLAKLTSEERRRAKAINFGIIYGISGFGLAKQIGSTPSQAHAFIEAYFKRFPELRDWMEQTKAFAHQHGYVQTFFRRRVHIPFINDKNAARRAGAERQAINAPLQGTAADIIKRAMIALPPALQKAQSKARLLLQVHDELLLEVPVKEVEETAALVKEIMQKAPQPVISLAVPLVAEVKTGDNWAQAH
ncbi:MAG: DNA polymerase I [Alphaproteobacteria bacterium]|nr:DNA polymerase I [Alphaproteobacteria bacterium]